MVELAWQDPVPGLSPGVLLWKQPSVPESLEAWQGPGNGSPSSDFSVGQEVCSLPLSFSWLTETRSIQAQSGGTSSWL